jgi:hypothetical protein
MTHPVGHAHAVLMPGELGSRIRGRCRRVESQVVEALPRTVVLARRTAHRRRHPRIRAQTYNISHVLAYLA